MKLSIQDRTKLQSYFVNKPVKRAYIFGSFAKGTAKKGISDIDILVELDHTNPIGLSFFTFQYELEDLLQHKVDLVSHEGLSRHIKPFIEKEKILIYDRATNR